MGRPRKPERQKKLEGTFRKDRQAPPPAPPLPPGMPAMPSWLNAEAKAEWERVAPQLLELKVLYPVDAALLADYCTAHSLAVNATKKYQREGLEVERYGQRVKHPMIKVAQEARSQARQHIGEFHKRLVARQKEVANPQLPRPPADPDDTPLFGPPLKVPVFLPRVVPKASGAVNE